MSEEIETLMMRQQELENLRGKLDEILESHRDTEPRLMTIFESLALGTSSVSELSRKYNLSEDAVLNAYKRAGNILRNHTSLRPYLDLLD